MEQYELKLSFKDLIKLLFYKKICPYCKAKLKSAHKNELDKRGVFSLENDTFFYGKKYNRYFQYYCNVCDRMVQLSELRKK